MIFPYKYIKLFNGFYFLLLDKVSKFKWDGIDQVSKFKWEGMMLLALLLILSFSLLLSPTQCPTSKICKNFRGSLSLIR